MTKRDLLRHFYLGSDRGLSFVANVLEGCSNPTKKLRGLYNLTQAGYCVGPAQFNSYMVRIDGKQRDIKVLEWFAPKHADIDHLVECL